MKTNFTIRTLLFVLLMFAVTSCSKSKMGNILDAIPANSDVVAVADVNTIMESLGGKIKGSDVTMPSCITDMMSSGQESEMEESLDMLQNSGINMEACAFVFNFKDNKPYIVVELDNKGKFIKSIEDKDYDEESDDDGMTIYEKKNEYCNDYVAIKGDIAYILPEVWSDDFKAKKFFSKIARDIEKKPFSETGMAEYIIEGNTGGVSIHLSGKLIDELRREGLPSEFADQCKGYACCKCDLNDNAANITLKMFDEDGKPMTADMLGKHINPDATINVDALKYINEEENMFYALSLKDFDWDVLNTFADAARFSDDERTGMVLIKSYLERIDGTVALGAGIKDGMASINRIGEGGSADNEIAATMVIEVKSGKAETIINDIKTLLDGEGVPYQTTSEGFRLSIPNERSDAPLTTVNVEKRGDIIVISNRAVEENDNQLISSIDFDNKNMVLAVNLPERNPFEEFGFNQRIKMVLYSNLKNMEVVLNLEVGEKGDAGVLEQIVKLAKNIEDKKHERSRAAYEEYEVVYDEDYAYDDTVEEALVEEVY